MLVEKEVIAPGTYWYLDQETGAPRRLDVSPSDTRYWRDQGAAMLSSGLTVPVPCEHDFNAHPMTPAEKLKNNAGWVRGYALKDIDDPKRGKVKDALFAQVEVLDPDIAKKLPRTIRWTSPWFNSFTDGSGKRWENVISHLALTTRPRVSAQQPFPSIAAALSMAQADARKAAVGKDGYTLSRAGLLRGGQPTYPMAFSMWSGAPLAADLPPKKKDKKPPKAEEPESEGGVPDANPTPGEDEGEQGGGADPLAGLGGAPTAGEGNGAGPLDAAGAAEPPAELANPLMDAKTDVKMEELLCDLLQALGVPMPDESNENEFKRHLYEAAMSKIKELTSKGMGKDEFTPDQNKPTTQQPNASQPNPLIGQVQQEAQPMYMSLEKINELPEPMRSVALSFHQETEKLKAETEKANKRAEAMRQNELKKASEHRRQRCALLGAMSPAAKQRLDAMLARDSMALSMDDNGVISDPMAETLEVLEKTLGEMPRLLTSNAASIIAHPQPTDAEALSDEQSTVIADGLARMMGAPMPATP